jgi:hypothetical protein
MEAIFSLVLIVSGLLVFGVAATTFGADSRDLRIRGH